MTVSKLPLRGTLVLCLSVALTACSWFKRPVAYADSQEAGRLEVPGELDRPSSDPALSVPAGGTGGSLLDEEGQKPPELGVATNAVAGAGTAAASFAVADETGNVYTRVGTALQSDGQYPIIARDPVQGVYRLQVTVPSGEKRHWWRLWRKPRPLRTELVVKVSRTDSGSEVSVGSASGAALSTSRASALLAMLKERLGAG